MSNMRPKKFLILKQILTKDLTKAMDYIRPASTLVGKHSAEWIYSV